MIQKFITAFALFFCVILNDGCHPPAKSNVSKLKYYISPSADFKHYSKFALIRHSDIDKSSTEDPREEARTLFELQNLLEDRGFVLIQKGESPDFYVTAHSDPIPDSLLSYENHFIDSLPSISIDTNQMLNSGWFSGFERPEDSTASIPETEVPAGQVYLFNSHPVSILAFKRDTKENLFYGIIKASYYTTAPGMARQLLMRRLITEGLPRSSIASGFANLKPGAIGLYIQILTDKGILYYPYIVEKPIRNSPAEKAALQPNDIIVKVDGMSTLNKSFAEVLRMIRGPVGDSVHLEILRKNQRIDFELNRVDPASLRN